MSDATRTVELSPAELTYLRGRLPGVHSGPEEKAVLRVVRHKLLEACRRL